jgi:glycerol-3-phosphate acyltransferase PlsY
VALVFLVLNGTVPPAYLVYAVIGVAVVWIAHADNIDRLLHGTERKFDLDMLSGRGGGAGGAG